MSQTIRLTQAFYQQRRETTDTQNSQELIEANHVGLKACGKRYEYMQLIPYPNKESMKTIAQVKLSN